MLGAHQSDPPDVPSLQEAGDSLLTLVNSERLTVSLYCLRRLLYTYSQSPSIKHYVLVRKDLILCVFHGSQTTRTWKLVAVSFTGPASER